MSPPVKPVIILMIEIIFTRASFVLQKLIRRVLRVIEVFIGYS